MGYIGQRQHSDVQKTIDNTITRIQEAGRIAGTLANNENVAKYAEEGVRFFLTGIGAWLSTGASEFVNRAEAGKLSE